MQERFKKYNHILKYETSQLEKVILGITTREDGLSPYPKKAFNLARYIDDDPINVTQHQEQLAATIHYPREQWVFPIQTHENKVVEVTDEDKGTNIDALSDGLYGVDGMYTYQSDILLTMCYADCVPIYFYSEPHHFVGLAHAGWRGTVGQIANEMVSKIDFDVKDLQVVIGPATSSTYEINDDIKSKFEQLPVDTNQFIDTRAEDRHGIDLKQANALLLEYAGVPKDNIYITNYATSEDLSLFFSYRVEKGNTGRMLAFIGQ
ncbi:peptidoglycan editing factor PgeF [Staphylococcus succinus]|uniref:peptidoglycan editing factor PgeF n=1 Tax=Staphylococcus succinus TaxID=61015 RepID=UPI000C33B97C|nr:peptidoglycan editing factor PgeF [Staphylococcus succinus]PKI22912.1 peptidoglycan editing factor PgeF [Staphylococcus succinus]